MSGKPGVALEAPWSFATVNLYAITGYFIYNIEGIIFGGATHKVYRVPSTKGTTISFGTVF